MKIVRRLFIALLWATVLACADPPEPNRSAPNAVSSVHEVKVSIKGSAIRPSEAREFVAVIGATVFDGTGSEPLSGATVLLKGDRIAAVGPSKDIEVPKEAHAVDAKGKWIVPGLIDSHIHFFQSASIYTRPDIVDLRGVRSYKSETEGIRARLDDTFRRWLVSGVTSVVDMGGPFWNFDVRNRSRETPFAPRVSVAGPLVSTVPRPQLDIGDPPIIEAPTAADARALVRKQLAAGTDLAKVWFIVSPEKGVEATIDMLKAVVAESHAAGVRVAVHATELESARAAVENGADILVHSVDDKELDDGLISMMKARGTILIPTLFVVKGYADVLGNTAQPSDIECKYGDPAALRSWKELEAASGKSPEQAAARRMAYDKRAPVMAANLKKLLRAGIPIAAGTDAGNVGTLHGPGLHTELAMMAAAGMTPREIIVSATRDAAKVFSGQPEMGTLEKGKFADMLILDADPLEDVANLQKIRLVVKGGAIMEPGAVHPPNPEWVVQKQVDAYNARDAEGFAAWFADDVEIKRHPGGELVLRGKKSLLEEYRALFESSPDLCCRVTSRMTHGDFVVDHELVSGIAGRPYLRAIAVYRVAEGLIREVWFLPNE